MKTVKLNLGEKDIIIQIPDDLEAKREEIFALAALETQEQIASGNVRVIERLWPCLICGKRYKDQAKLTRHLLKHESFIEQSKEKLRHLYEKPLEPKQPILSSPKSI